MAAPTSYTEADLKAYMHSLANKAGMNLGWSVANGNYDEPVNEVELVFDAAIDEITNMLALRAVARRELWRSVMAATTHLATSQSGIGGSIAYGKTTFDRAKDLFKFASEDVAALGLGEIDNKPSISVWIGGAATS
jgi:hypothetical protein